ncbi:MAG: glycerate kinase family protein [Solirubrobacteraceae bacterium]
MALQGIPTAVLVAPDAFKGTYSAVEVTEAIARGFEAEGRAVDRCPIADGGEGTLDALMGALGAQAVMASVHDPLSRAIHARFGLILARGPESASSPARLSAGRACPTNARARRTTARACPTTAIVEAAAASGLGLVDERERDAVAAGTFGTGELVLASVRAGAEVVYLGVGGSASTDGGAGAIRAIREGGGLRAARLVVLCDVRTPFEEAARVFGPQKGADEREVNRLTSRLHALARELPRDPRGVPMTGAAGGLAGGLWAAFGASLVPGSGFVLDAVGFDRRMRAARAVVTGEGRLDRQSLAGKAVSEVATRARQAGVPCHAIVARRELDAFDARILDLQAVLQAGTREELERAGRELAALL